MGATHVFVETNWVVDICAPSHFRTPAAANLFEKAKAGSLAVHVPGLCLSEARNVIRRKFQPRYQLTPIRKYILWAKDENKIDESAAKTVRDTLEQYEHFVSAELGNLEATVGNLIKTPGVQAFPLSERMLERSLSLTIEKLELHAFDNAVLAAILTRAEEIKFGDKDSELFFCTVDEDLQPWDKNGNAKPVLQRLYDEARVWVYGDFGMTSRERPDDWPR